MFEFLGLLLGFAARTTSAIDFNFPPLFWKRLIGEKPTIDDLRDYDMFTYQVLSDMQDNGKSLSEDVFNEKYHEDGIKQFFKTTLTSGEEIELCPEGATKLVSFENYKEFIELVLKERLYEAEQQM